jgi:hypothetical protein
MKQTAIIGYSCDAVGKVLLKISSAYLLHCSCTGHYHHSKSTQNFSLGVGME